MDRLLIAATTLMLAMSLSAAWADDADTPDASNDEAEQDSVPAALDFTMTDIAGEPVELSSYVGDVVLMVNVASQCGATPQYADLQTLHEQYAERGLAILGFPCNQFGNQEPGSDEDVANFCRSTYHVAFDMFSKIEVNGEGAAPLYQYLTGEDCPVEDKGEVKWNFEKFLLDREGNVIARFRTGVKPTDEQVVAAIEQALGPPPQ